jgi:hypothetical protein
MTMDRVCTLVIGVSINAVMSQDFLPLSRLEQTPSPPPVEPLSVLLRRWESGDD